MPMPTDRNVDYSLIYAMLAIVVICCLTFAGPRVVQPAMNKLSTALQETSIAASPAVTALPPATAISPSPTVTNDLEALVLMQVGERISMCPPKMGSNAFFISADESPIRFSLSCGVGWGHVSDVAIWRYDNSPAAQAAFANLRGDLPPQDFHGYAAIEWRCFARSYANCEPSNGIAQGMLHRNHCWQADRWLICAHAFDDTSIETAVDPLKISEAVYQASLVHGLFPQK